MNSINDYLSQQDQTWQSIKLNIPNGNYQGIIQEAKIIQSKDNIYYLKFVIKILAPTNENSIVSKLYSLSDEKLKYLKKDLETLGVALESLTNLPSILESLLNKKIEISLTSKGDYQNCFINKLIESLATPF